MPPATETFRRDAAAWHAAPPDAVLETMRRAGISEDACVAAVAGVTSAPASLGAVRALKGTLLRAGAADDGSVERTLLLLSAARSAPAIPFLPVAEAVKRRFAEEFDHLAAPTTDAARHLAVDATNFVGMCKLVTLRRFPAGQLHWELSGIPRSLFLEIRPRELPRLAAFVARRMRGLRPLFVAHLAWYRRGALVLLEREQLRSLHRMARSMALQPAVRGFMSFGWFHSRENHRVSPHLAWLNRVFDEEGGCIAMAGPAAPTSGALTASHRRQTLYETGDFVPTTALALWPREAMLRWADANPQLAE
jgi:hypothetical protein